jgi:hypothetical protein
MNLKMADKKLFTIHSIVVRFNENWFLQRSLLWQQTSAGAKEFCVLLLKDVQKRCKACDAGCQR